MGEAIVIPALGGNLAADAADAAAYFEAATRTSVPQSQLRDFRYRFLHRHAGALYWELTDGGRLDRRVEDLVFDAADRVPGLAPTRAEMGAERELSQSAKQGLELDQGILLAHFLADVRSGTHLCHAMLRPRRESVGLREEFGRTGRADLGLATVERIAGVGQVELRNPRFLNAEDDAATAALEIGVDLVLRDPGCAVGVLRGGVVDHPRHAGRRVFNAGINLTHLYYGKISFVDFMMAREMGLLAKIQRGNWLSEDWSSGLEDTVEKPWIMAVESFAIGGGCQLLLVADRVIAEQGAYFNLPARREGIIPGNANQRLARFVGERTARQAIMFERAFPVDDPVTAALCDVVVPREGMDEAIAADAAQLVSAGPVSAAANRKAMRITQEPIDQFRRYMAMYAIEQSRCLYAPALIENLERNWQARQRRL